MSTKISYREVPGQKEVVVIASWPSQANAHTLRSIHTVPTNYGDLDGTATTYAIIENIREKIYRGARVELANTIKGFAYSCDKSETWLAITLQPSVSGVKRAIMAIAENVCPSSAGSRYDSVVRSFGLKPSREAFNQEAAYIHSHLDKSGINIVVIGKISGIKDDHRSAIESGAARAFKDNMSSPGSDRKERTLESVKLHEYAFSRKLKGCGSYLLKKLISDKLRADCYIIGDELVSNTPIKEDRLKADLFDAFATQVMKQVKEDLAARIAMRCASQAYFPPSDIASFANQRLTKESIISHLRA